MRILKRLIKGEEGQTMPVVLILLLIGGLIIGPLMGNMSTGLKAGVVYEDNMALFYAADSGIEDALWRAKYDQLPAGYNQYAYYDNNPSYVWGYDVDGDLPATYDDDINGMDVDVDIINVWIPKDIAAPTPAAAQAIIADAQLVVLGIPSGANQYQIKIDYYYETDSGQTDYDPTGQNLLVDKLGIWLPPGFHYNGNCSLEAEAFYNAPTVERYSSGEAVVWNFSPNPSLASIAGGSGFPLVSTITFDYTVDVVSTTPGGALSWVETTGVTGVDYSWDADTRVFKITATATDPNDLNRQSIIDAYTVKTELRQLSAAIEGDYRAIGNSLMTASGDPRYRDTLLPESSATISIAQGNDIPTDAQVAAAYLYWSGWYDRGMDATPPTLFEDTCANFNQWTEGSRWSIDSGEFWGRGSGSVSTASRMVTMTDSVDLSGCSSGQALVTWEQDEGGNLESSDYLYYAFSGDGGSNWSSNYVAFNNDNPPLDNSFSIPDAYLTSDFKMRFYWYADSTSEYCYVDNINIYRLIWYEDCDDYDDWTDGNNWSIYNGDEFNGEGSGSTSDRRCTMTSSLDLSTYSGRTINVSWQQRETGGWEGSDELWFAFSGDGGGSWSSDNEAFSNDIGDTFQSFSAQIPDEYLTNNFKMRFYIDANSSWEDCYINDLMIFESIMTAADFADDTCYFEVNGSRVYFDGSGDPQIDAFGTEEITATRAQVINNLDYGNPHGYSYSSYRDVTQLVRYGLENTVPFTTDGNGTYTVGGVDADANGDEWAYAGWSLIIIYSSPQTEGHQLYLYDDFLYCDHQTNLDFDQDGQPGGTISGFLVPAPIAGEVNVAKITCFVGEGDDVYNGDFIAINAPSNNPPTAISNSYKLWDGVGDLNDVWNGLSLGMSAQGVDVDTFYVTWASGLLNYGDTSTQIDIYTDVDIWNFVYIILSFRSESTSGGAITYLVRG